VKVSTTYNIGITNTTMMHIIFGIQMTQGYKQVGSQVQGANIQHHTKI